MDMNQEQKAREVMELFQNPYTDVDITYVHSQHFALLGYTYFHLGDLMQVFDAFEKINDTQFRGQEFFKMMLEQCVTASSSKDYVRYCLSRPKDLPKKW